ncbi:MAG TPA: copper-binding protein [Candidatus Binatia bacterium]|nr:copper-binding protein [Candidatus Binatia bacterium]
MKSKGKYLVAVVLLPLTACAAYQMQPLSMNHPANPEAAAVPVRTVSKTLAYTRADIPSPQPLAAATMPQGQGAQQTAQSEKQTVVGEGKVVATVPNAGQIVVDHEEIQGFMEAMTMGYRVDPPSLLEGLKQGDKVRFTIDVPRKAIVKIEKGPALAAVPSAQKGQGSPAGEQSGAQKTVVGEGKVIATVPNASQIVVEHGEIKGFMEAMTMGYRVDPPSLMEGLKSGDTVRFTIDVPKKAIVKIEKIK